MPSIFPLMVLLFIVSICTVIVGGATVMRFLEDGAGLWTFIWSGVLGLCLFAMYQLIAGLRKVLSGSE